LLKSELISRDVSIRLDISRTDCPATSGDSIQLQQVLLNLVMKRDGRHEFYAGRAAAYHDLYPGERSG